MTTPRDDIAGLSERLRERTRRLDSTPSGMLNFMHGILPLLNEAATALDERDALSAMVKDATTLAKENAKLRTWIDLHRGDVMSLSGEVDNFRSELQAEEARAARAEARVKELEGSEDDLTRADLGMEVWRKCALRAEQERDSLVRDYQRVNAQLAEEMKARGRAEQERDEAYERAAKVCEGLRNNDNSGDWYEGADACADAIRRLASGPEKEKKK